MPNWTIHIEQSRSWWTGHSRTLCWRTITEVEVSGRGWLAPPVTCPTCAAIEQRGGGR